MRWLMLVILPLVMLAGGSCFLKPKIGPFYSPADIYVSNQYPAPGEEIVVSTSQLAVTQSTGRATSMGSAPAVTFSATGGQFRQKNAPYDYYFTHDESEVFVDLDYDGQSITPNQGTCYWKAPEKEGKYFLTAVRGEYRRSIKVFVEAPE